MMAMYLIGTGLMKDTQFCAYFRLWTILVCSCDQSHVQDKLKFGYYHDNELLMVFMHIATEVHESHMVRM